MNVPVRLATAGLVRAPGRTIIRIAVVALATALLGAMLLFVGASLRTMTGSAVRSVPIDWQAPVASSVQAERIARRTAGDSGILEALPAATAPFLAASHKAPAGSIRTGSGAVLAVPTGYASRFPTLRLLHGGFRAGEIVLDQQLAATLQARIGDRVSLVPGRHTRPRVYRVSGVALVTAAGQLFQPLDPRLGPAPAQPPAQIAIIPFETFSRTYAPALRSLSRASVGSSAVPGALNGVQWQVQAQVDPADLGSTPAAALRREGQIRNRVETELVGQALYVDNLSDGLTTAAGDSLYAETLFIMLAVPGALVALGLVYLAALGTAERDRHDLVLLRARGASRRKLVLLAAVESLLLAAVAGISGAGLAVAATSALIPGGVALSSARIATTAVACVAFAFAGCFAARLAASASTFAGTVGQARRSGDRPHRPLWQRLYLDVVALVLSALVYSLTARTGFSAVINPDSNPTLSLSVYMFFAPALLWLGATLLLLRLRGGVVSWLARRGTGQRASTMRGFLLSSAGRRGAAINRGLLLVGLLLAFGVNLGIFTATYDEQARIDAELTLGADVVATAPPATVSARHLARRIANVAGVAAVSAVDHSFAYIGPDLQDTYGIDPATIGKATKLRDSYFLGGSAAQMLDRLRQTRDGILVSKETITDYSLKTGDALRLRVLDHRTGRFRIVGFHVVGTVQEFPSAPKDSFMVANLQYLTAAAHDGGPNVVFARTGGDPVAVADRIAAVTRNAGTNVRDIREQTQETVSSITTVDLTGIARIEAVFAVVLAAAAMSLFVALGLGERRHEFATMAALGASLRQISVFLWSEAAIVLCAALVLAAGLGWLLSLMLVAMLRHVFDPPPDSLVVPWTFLAVLAAAAFGGAVVACAAAMRGVRRLPLGSLLRER